MNILSFNILAPCWAAPQWYPEGMNPDLLNRDYRRDRIIDTLSSTNSDLICLQEVTNFEFRAITAALPFFKGFMAHNNSQYWSEWLVPEIESLWEPNGTAILVRKSMFSSLHFEDRALSNSGNHAACLSAIHTSTNSGFRLWSIHLDGSNESIRNAELASLLSQVTNNSEIIAGDFNIDGSDLRDTMKEAHFIDALRSAGNFTPTDPFDQGRSNTHMIMDHIMVRGAKPIAGDVLEYGLLNISDDTKRMEATLEKVGSDHFPVLSTIRLESS